MIRFLDQVVNLNVGWIMYDLIWVLIVMAFMLYCYHVIEDKNKKGIFGFALLMLFLWGFIDFVPLFGWKLFQFHYLLEFFLIQFSVVYLAANTRWQKHILTLLVVSTLVLSFLIT